MYGEVQLIPGPDSMIIFHLGPRFSNKEQGVSIEYIYL